MRTGGSLGHSSAPWPWPLRLQIFICEMQIQECYLGVPLWTLVSQQPCIGGSSFHCRQSELSTLGRPPQHPGGRHQHQETPTGNLDASGIPVVHKPLGPEDGSTQASEVEVVFSEVALKVIESVSAIWTEYISPLKL